MVLVPDTMDTVTLTLRLPREVHQALVDSAAARRTSLNSEILDRVRYTFRQEDYRPLGPISDLDEVQARLVALERAIYGGD
jgi:hypothetical protein